MNLYSNEHGLQIKHKENYLFFSLLGALCPEVTSFCRVSGNYQRQVNGFYLEQSRDRSGFRSIVNTVEDVGDHMIRIYTQMGL